MKVNHVVLVLVILMVVFVVVSGSGRAADPADYDYMHEYPLPAGWGSPEDIVVGNDGHIWFTLRNGQYEVGELIVTTAPDIYDFKEYSLPDGQEAGSIAFANGFAWVTVPALDKLVRLPAVNSEPNEWSLPPNSEPAGIAAAPNGVLWIAAPGTSQILKFDQDTKSLTAYDYTSDNAGIREVATVANDTIYFTAENLDRVVRFRPAYYPGDPFTAFTSLPLTDVVLGSLGQPGQVAVNEAGDIWVVAVERDWLGQFNFGTLTFWMWKEVPPANGEPFGLALSQIGAAKVVWFTLPNVGIVGQLGQGATGDLFIREHPIPSAGSAPRSIAVDDANHGWIAVAGSDLIAEWVPPYNATLTLPLVVNNTQ